PGGAGEEVTDEGGAGGGAVARPQLRAVRAVVRDEEEPAGEDHRLGRGRRGEGPERNGACGRAVRAEEGRGGVGLAEKVERSAQLPEGVCPADAVGSQDDRGAEEGAVGLPDRVLCPFCDGEVDGGADAGELGD